MSEHCSAFEHDCCEEAISLRAQLEKKTNAEHCPECGSSDMAFWISNYDSCAKENASLRARIAELEGALEKALELVRKFDAWNDTRDEVESLLTKAVEVKR